MDHTWKEELGHLLDMKYKVEIEDLTYLVLTTSLTFTYP